MGAKITINLGGHVLLDKDDKTKTADAAADDKPQKPVKDMSSKERDAAIDAMLTWWLNS